MCLRRYNLQVPIDALHSLSNEECAIVEIYVLPTQTKYLTTAQAG